MILLLRWNTGLTKNSDPRIAKLGEHHIGKIPHNALITKFKHRDTGNVVEGRTIKEAAKLAGISIATANRLKHGTIKHSRTGWVYCE